METNQWWENKNKGKITRELRQAKEVQITKKMKEDCSIN